MEIAKNTRISNCFAQNTHSLSIVNFPIMQVLLFNYSGSYKNLPDETNTLTILMNSAAI